MTKLVVLARPHPFIVSEMGPFMKEAGFEPVRIESADDIVATAPKAAGAVVSLAVSASIEDAPESVVAQLRRVSPRLPILFASLIDRVKIEPTLTKVLQASGIGRTIVDVDAAQSRGVGRSPPGAAIYLCKNDLLSPERRAVAAQLVREYFR